MPLVSTSSFSFGEVLSVGFGIVGVLSLLNERSILKSPGNWSLYASLIEGIRY